MQTWYVARSDGYTLRVMFPQRMEAMRFVLGCRYGHRQRVSASVVVTAEGRVAAGSSRDVGGSEQGEGAIADDGIAASGRIA